ncbi:hypothetical protein JMJ56_32690 [Belnapia sp. T18]|uniref:Uncharacterized protein n=1 Tax=Belnapia arida TaxID=2804533 RepID=A0ABS1UG81_9PROT|nr:hypothetical protein [Belnapia arida]MBL6082717.1 hypothetical protein [Belnapia arida]
MPLDATTFSQHRPRPQQTPCLDEAERHAAACFGPRLHAALAATPPTGLALTVLACMSQGVAGAHFRIVVQGLEQATPRHGEVVVASVPAGLPKALPDLRVLALRIASAAAGAWRQRCQIERLGLIAGQ